jgi:starvation-inducible DNA-binding protein
MSTTRIACGLHGVRKMHVSNAYASSDSPIRGHDDADSACRDIVTVLEELLVHSIQLRDLYKYGRLQAAGTRFRHLFDTHYKEQLRVVDVLIDRLRMLAGTGRVFASNFLQGTQVFRLHRSRWSLMGMMRDLMERHEWVLSVARPFGRDDRSWSQDFAVGQVVLTNDLQAWSVSEQAILPRDNAD